MKPLGNLRLALPVVVMATIGFVGCSKSSPNQAQNQPGQNFAPNSGSSSSPDSGFAPRRSRSGYGNASNSGSGSGNQSQASQSSSQAPAPQPMVVTIPRGTEFRVALDRSISSATAQTGDPFTATLLNPISENGMVIIPRDARVNGHLVAARASGRLSGTAELEMTLDSVQISGNPVRIRTDVIARLGKTHKKRDIIAIGGGSALGAIIGGIAGGGKGAAIGAAAGAGAGTAGAAATGKENITLPTETTLAFRLTSPIRLTN
jgi:hypothetical protein